MPLTPQQIHRRMTEFRIGTLIKPNREIKLCELIVQKDGRAWLDWDNTRLITEFENKKRLWLIVDAHVTPGFDQHYYVKIFEFQSGRVGWTESLALYEPVLYK